MILSEYLVLFVLVTILGAGEQIPNGHNQFGAGYLHRLGFDHWFAEASSPPEGKDHEGHEQLHQLRQAR